MAIDKKAADRSDVPRCECHGQQVLEGSEGPLCPTEALNGIRHNAHGNTIEHDTTHSIYTDLLQDLAQRVRELEGEVKSLREARQQNVLAIQAAGMLVPIGPDR